MVGMSEEFNQRVEPVNFSERGVFRSRLDGVLNNLIEWEQTLFTSELQRHHNFFQLRTHLETDLQDLPDSENALFHNLFGLFEIKHGIGEGNKILSTLLKKDHGGKFIGFLGPLGVGKTTVANALINDLDAQSVTHEPYENNPFWKLSQEDSSFMLRSQMYFFLSNIFSDMKTRLHPGTSVSDTSTLTDILMWADWYNKTGNFDEEDYQVYQKMIEVFKGIVPKPDLLVSLVPTSVDKLKEGIRRRGRPSEQRFATEESLDLAIQTERVNRLIEIILREWGVNVLPITVSPLQVYHDPSLPYDYIYQIRERLGLLGELLNPQPEAVADEVVRILAESDQRQVVVIHAESMFTGKTTALWMVANKLGTNKVLAFQPRAAIHSAKKDNAVVTRDQYEIEGVTIGDNNLQTIVNKIKQENISPKDKPYILIDEIQLFTAHKDAHQQALDALEELRQMGFHVIVDGIDYTFQQEPFTFMHYFLEMAKQESSNWHQIQMATRCRYCHEPARGTRRWKIHPDGRRTIADYNDTVFVAGDSEYEPVCCQGDHVSCLNQPPDFQRKELPVKNWPS